MQCIYRKRVNPVSRSSVVLRVRIDENVKHRQSTQQYICKLLRLPVGRGKGSGRGEAWRGTKLTLTFPLRAFPPSPPLPFLVLALATQATSCSFDWLHDGCSSTNRQTESRELLCWGMIPFRDTHNLIYEPCTHRSF